MIELAAKAALPLGCFLWRAVCSVTVILQGWQKTSGWRKVCWRQYFFCWSPSPQHNLLEWLKTILSPKPRHQSRYIGLGRSFRLWLSQSGSGDGRTDFFAGTLIMNKGAAQSLDVQVKGAGLSGIKSAFYNYPQLGSYLGISQTFSLTGRDVDLVAEAWF